MHPAARCTLAIICGLTTSVKAHTLFIAEAAEGSGYNKYIELYNPTPFAIHLLGYAMGSVSNAPTTVGSHEYWTSFADGASIPAGGVYIICDSRADATILDKCDEATWQYLSNGDDAYCLSQGNATTHAIIDCVGDYQGDPGSGWNLCGVVCACAARNRSPHAHRHP